MVSSLQAAESTKMRKMGDNINILNLKKTFSALNKVYVIQPNTSKSKINYCNFLKSQFVSRVKNLATTLVG